MDMRLQSFALALMLTVSAPALADEPEVRAEALKAAALRSSLAYEFLRDLTTQIGPRTAGSAAERRAADWAVARLKAMGFANARLESFPVDGWVRGVEHAELVGAAPQKLVLTALGSSVPTPPEGIEADVALFRSYAALLAAPAGSLKGKIVVVTQRTIKAQDGAGYGATGAIRRAGASEAAKRGAVAYLLRSLGTSGHRFAHTGQMRYADDVARIPAAAMSSPDAEQLERLADAGVALRMKLKLTPSLPGALTSQNVIADIRGREKPDEYVVIGGHIDSWDPGTGALDDGAGVAITTAAAKLILDLPERPKRSIRLILWGSEEVGLVGARAYVAAQGPEGMKKHVIGAESDFGAGRIYEFCGTVGEGALPAMARIHASLESLGIFKGGNACAGGPDLSPKREAGMPVAELQQDGRDYFDYHHTPDDTFDKVEKAALDQNVAAYAAFAWMAANLDADFRAPAKK
jgi:carboxypeptidase Q